MDVDHGNEIHRGLCATNETWAPLSTTIAWSIWRVVAISNGWRTMTFALLT
jgi:hypothetical protein